VPRRKILVLAPHTDDEMLGCGGTLLKVREADCADVMVAVMSCGARYLSHLGNEVSESEQLQEFLLCAPHISSAPARWYECGHRLEEEPMYKVVRWLDQLLRDFAPTTLLIPEPSYHQEHQMVYRAAIAACRPTYGRPTIEDIYLYEIPTGTWSGADGLFRPNVYVDIGEHLEEKIALFRSIYKAQYTESSREMLGERGIRSHAQYRAAEVGQEYSEAFMLLRSSRREGAI